MTYHSLLIISINISKNNLFIFSNFLNNATNNTFSNDKSMIIKFIKIYNNVKKYTLTRMNF